MGPNIPIINTGQPVVDPQTTFTPESLSTAFQTYRKELIVMPMYAMAQALQHMGHRDGIRYKEHVHEMKGNFQMGNYDKYKKGDGEESDAFCAESEAAPRNYLDKQMKSGTITPAERKAIGH